LATGLACAFYSQESGIRLYFVLLFGSTMGALAGYFIWVAISFGVRAVRGHSLNSSTNDNNRRE
jgi:hypothetical protein